MEMTVASAIAEIVRRPIGAWCETCEQPTSFEDARGGGSACSRCGAARDAAVVPLRRVSRRASRRRTGTAA